MGLVLESFLFALDTNSGPNARCCRKRTTGAVFSQELSIVVSEIVHRIWVTGLEVHQD